MSHARSIIESILTQAHLVNFCLIDSDVVCIWGVFVPIVLCLTLYVCLCVFCFVSFNTILSMSLSYAFDLLPVTMYISRKKLTAIITSKSHSRASGCRVIFVQKYKQAAAGSNNRVNNLLQVQKYIV